MFYRGYEVRSIANYLVIAFNFAVSERLGHGKIVITLDTYHHAIDETKIKLMNNTADFARILPDK